MAETYIVGETKVRPGAYFNIQKTGNNAAASIISGVTAVIFKGAAGTGPFTTLEEAKQDVIAHCPDAVEQEVAE